MVYNIDTTLQYPIVMVYDKYFATMLQCTMDISLMCYSATFSTLTMSEHIESAASGVYIKFYDRRICKINFRK